jgi:hypothetical protein
VLPLHSHLSLHVRLFLVLSVTLIASPSDRQCPASTASTLGKQCYLSTLSESYSWYLTSHASFRLFTIGGKSLNSFCIPGQESIDRSQRLIQRLFPRRVPHSLQKLVSIPSYLCCWGLSETHKMVQSLRTAHHDWRLPITNYSTAHMQVETFRWMANIEHLSTRSIIYGLKFSLNSHINVTNMPISYPHYPVLQQSPIP